MSTTDARALADRCDGALSLDNYEDRIVAMLRAQADELDRLSALVRCSCGDEFTANDPGTCGNCKAGETAVLHVEIERLTAELQTAADDATRAYAQLVDAKRARQEAQIRQEQLTSEIVRLEPMRQRAADIERLTAELDGAKAALALVQQHHATAWNRGHAAGLRAAQEQIENARNAVRSDVWGNSQLTEALMSAEAERDALRAELAAMREQEPPAQVDRLTDEWLMHAAGATLYLHHRPAIDRLVRACATAWGVMLEGGE